MTSCNFIFLILQQQIRIQIVLGNWISYYEDKIGKIISNIMKKVEERMAKIIMGINNRRRREYEL